MSHSELQAKNARPRERAYKLADGGGLFELLAFESRQSADAMVGESAMRAGSGEVRDAGLEGAEATI